MKFIERLLIISDMERKDHVPARWPSSDCMFASGFLLSSFLFYSFLYILYILFMLSFGFIVLFFISLNLICSHPHGL